MVGSGFFRARITLLGDFDAPKRALEIQKKVPERYFGHVFGSEAFFS